MCVTVKRKGSIGGVRKEIEDWGDGLYVGMFCWVPEWWIYVVWTEAWGLGE